MTTSATRLLAIAASLFLLAALAWPALYNGQPIFFSDTTAYIRGADAGIQAALHRRSPWSLSGEDAITKTSTAAPAVPARKSVSSIKDKTILTGRSPFYGGLLYLGELTGGFWLSILLQSLAVLVTLALVLRAAKVSLWPYLLLISVPIVVTTTAPFFVSFLMPDVFAGVAILAASVMLAVRRRLNGLDYLAAFSLLCASAIFHDSHAIILLLMMGGAIAYNLFRRSWTNWRGLTIVALVLVCALAAQVLFNLAVQRVIGAPPLRPPFLMARVIEDGPGHRYLVATCPASGFAVCAFVDRLPIRADAFLWDSGNGGVFADASPEVRRQLSSEQMRFVFAVIASAPWRQLSASLRNWAEQLAMVGLSEFQYSEADKISFATKIPAEHFDRMQRSAAYRGTMPVNCFDALVRAAFLIGALVVFALFPLRLQSLVRSQVAALLVWALVGVLANAAVCGILSGPHERYSARVSWLIPFAALLWGASATANWQQRVRPKLPESVQ